MKTKDLILIAMFASITAVLSLMPAIPLPFSPVPITFQVLGVFLAGAILGGKRGFLSQLLYVILGCVGLPIFAGGQAGLSVLFGPTGGYLIGFVIAAGIVGLIVEKNEKDKFYHVVFAMCIGLIVIYVLGTIQLSLVTGLPLKKAFVVGSLPYIPLDALKGLFAVLVAMPTRARLKQLRLC
jgi:biotin transport system substrate-specific component